MTTPTTPDVNYIIASGDNRGKRLVRKLKAEIAANGTVAVIAFTESGVQRTHNAIQRLANETGMRISVLPYSDVVNGVPVFTALVSPESGNTVSPEIGNAENVGAEPVDDVEPEDAP